MRIITHGDLQELGQVYCSKCHCLYGYNKTDLNYKYLHPDTESGYEATVIIPFVICPECGTTAFVEGIME